MAHTMFYPRLDEFRAQGKYIDVYVRIGDRSFQGHRLILALLSRYFEDLFQGQAGTAVVETVVLDNVDASAFEELLRIVYTGELGIIDDFSALLRACDTLQVHSSLIEDQCIIVSQRRKPMRNVFSILEYASDRQKLSLVESLIRNISKCAEYYFFRNDSFLELPYRLLVKIFEHGDLADFISMNGDQLADAFIRWTHHSLDERRVHLKRLMDMVIKRLSSAYMRGMLDTLLDGLLDTNTSAPVLQRIAGTLPKWTTRYEDEKLLNVSIGYEDRGLIREFSRANGTHWSAVKKWPWRPSMKKAGIDDRVYCLVYNGMDEQTFSCRPLAGNSLDQELKPPPHTLRHYEMRPWQTGKLIYVFDKDVNTAEEDRSDRLLIFDTAKNDWYAAPPTRHSVENASIAVDEDSVYLVGWEGQNLVAQAFQHSTQTWRLLNILPAGDVRRSTELSCCVHEGKIYIGDRERDEIHCYDPRAGESEPLQNDDFCLVGYELISYCNKLGAVGLHETGRTPVELYYDVSAQMWCRSPSLFLDSKGEFDMESSLDVKDCAVF